MRLERVHMYHDMFDLGEFLLDPVMDLFCNPMSFLNGDLAVDAYLDIDIDPIAEESRVDGVYAFDTVYRTYHDSERILGLIIA